MVLIHGFGVSSFQYRDTLEALSLTNKVYALDLVGFGSSGTTRDTLSPSLSLSLSLFESLSLCYRFADQPDTEYCMEFWRDQVRHTNHVCEQHSHTLTGEWRKVFFCLVLTFLSLVRR